MELFLHLGLLRFCLLCLTEVTFCGDNEPAVIKVIVEEDSDVILPCSLSTKEDIVQKLLHWMKDGQQDVFLYDAGIHNNNEQFKGRVSHFPDELKNGNASIIIRNMKLVNSGDYTCDFPLQQKREISHVALVVVAAAQPYIRIVDLKEDRLLLLCEVHGASPKPKLELQDSAGNILPAEETQVSERGGSYNITLQTNVTKTDRCRCVATQEEINHMPDAHIYVHISGNNMTKCIIGVLVGIVTLVAFFVALQSSIEHQKK